MSRIVDQPQWALLTALARLTPSARARVTRVGADERHTLALPRSGADVRRARGWLARLIAPLGGGRSDRDIDAELRSHIDLHIADNIRAGMPSEAARREAWIALGGLERTKDEYRDQRG